MAGGRRVQRFDVAQDVVQSVESIAADMPGDFPLRALPVRCGGGEGGDALPGERDFARPRVAPRHDGHQLAFGQRVEVARKRRAVEQIARGEVADA